MHPQFMSNSINGVKSVAWNGIQRNLRGLQRSAHEVASAATGAKDVVDYVGPLADLQRRRQAIEASAKMIALTDRTLGTIIDRLA